MALWKSAPYILCHAFSNNAPSHGFSGNFTMLRRCFNNDRDSLCEHYDSFEQLRTTFVFKSNVYEADVAEIYTDDASKLLAFV